MNADFYSAADILLVCDLLYRLGITANYIGFFHVSYALLLALHNPDRLLLAKKWLYPSVAHHYNISLACVERSIRTAVRLAWTRNRPLFERMACHPLPRQPSPAAFLEILTFYLLSNQAA